MRNSWKHLRRFTYLILFFFFDCCLPVFANFFSSEFNIKAVASPPEAIDVNNFLIQNISGRSQILPLIGKDSDGSVFSFKVLTLPAAAAGTLYLNNVAVIINQVISPAQAKQLQFEVQTTFTGTIVRFFYS